MNIDFHPLGALIETNYYQILLGNRESQISGLQQHFPQVNFKRIKQVHGDRTVHTSPQMLDFSSEADAHYTSDKGVGLCISTADCIPLFFYNHQPRWICAIHAGWRGIEKRIVPKAIANLKRNGCKPEELQVFVGPHIQKFSFEVGNDVRDQLLRSFDGPHEAVWSATEEKKSKVDLHQILMFQLMESEVSLQNTYFELKDTVSDPQYHSFRRDKENSGRQLSFIVLKK